MAPPFLTSALNRGKQSVSRPGRFTPEERALGIHWIGGWVGLRKDLEVMEERKIRAPAGNRTPVVHPVA
jgi:hypothetical protein